MGLRLKIASTITLIFVAVIAATYLLFSQFLLNEFRQLERARTGENLARVFQSITAVKEELRIRSLDWGHWDESYNFLLGNNPGYVESNLNYEALLPFELQHFIYTDNTGHIFHAGELSETAGSVIALKAQSAQAILQHEKIAAFIKSPTNSALTGLLVVDSQPLFISISTITDSKQHEKSVGFLIFTRSFSAKLQATLAQQTQLDLSFQQQNSSHPMFSAEQNASSQAILENEDSITGLGVFRDLSDRPIIVANFSQPRDILHQGEETRDLLVVVIASFLILANGIVILFINRTVLNPLARFARRITTISKTNDLTLKVPIDRGAEIGELSKVFNALIDSLRISYQRIHYAKNEALEANEAKSRFIAMISHELRTPIHSITGMLRILKQHEQSENKRSYITMADEAAYGLLATINEVLDFSKVESGNLSLETIEFNLREVVKEALRNVAPRTAITSGPVDLVVDVSPDVPQHLLGDPLRLRQILTNLLGNACKFTHEGHVALCVHSNDSPKDNTSLLTITVNGTGIGIPQDKLPYIFEPFHQAESSTTRLYQGTGLGLTIVQQIVAQMGGNIDVTSTPHYGTTFIITIPFLTVATEKNSIRSATLKPKTLALIARDSSALPFILTGLQRRGDSVELFDSAKPQEISDLYKRIDQFDHLILWDTGQLSVESLTELTQAALATQCPVLVLVNPADLARCDSPSLYGTSSYLLTPASPDEVLVLVHGLASHDLGHVDDTTPYTQDTPLHIIIADDSPTNCIILKSLLEESGHSVEVVTNGLDLLNRIRPIAYGEQGTREFDLVLTDIQMPIMDGNTAARKLRLLEGGAKNSSRLPMVAVTAHALPEELLNMRRSGIDQIITKPIDPEELRRIVRACSGASFATTSLAKNDKKETSVEKALLKIVNRLSAEYGEQTNHLESSSLIDIKGIFERSGQSLRRTRMILMAFLSAYGAQRDLIIQHATQYDAYKLKRALHTIKGLLLDVGADSAAALTAQLEELCANSTGLDIQHEQLTHLINSLSRVASLIGLIVAEIPLKGDGLAEAVSPL